jgi:hypothetical protein
LRQHSQPLQIVDANFTLFFLAANCVPDQLLFRAITFLLILLYLSAPYFIFEIPSAEFWLSGQWNLSETEHKAKAKK